MRFEPIVEQLFERWLLTLGSSLRGRVLAFGDLAGQFGRRVPGSVNGDLGEPSKSHPRRLPVGLLVEVEGLASRVSNANTKAWCFGVVMVDPPISWRGQGPKLSDSERETGRWAPPTGHLTYANPCWC